MYDSPTDLSPLIAEIDTLRLELGYQRWSHLRPWSDNPRPQLATGDELELLLERLCCWWADRCLPAREE